MNNKLLLIGGGGHCHSVLDSIIASGLYDEVGIIDTQPIECMGVHVVGTDDDLPRLFAAGWHKAFITVGSVGNTDARRRIYTTIKSIGYRIETIIDPTAILGCGVNIHEGCYIGKRAVLNSGVTIGNCSIINTGAIIEHDCVVGDFSHISPGAILCGQVIVGNNSHIGAGSVVKQQIDIGDFVMIGAGSVVVKSIRNNNVAYGNPCRVVD